jgi:hypothetical protein
MIIIISSSIHRHPYLLSLCLFREKKGAKVQLQKLAHHMHAPNNTSSQAKQMTIHTYTRQGDGDGTHD